MNLLLSLALLVVLAQASPNPANPGGGLTITQEVVPWANIATSVSFGALAWYLITVQLPRMQDKFSEEIKASRESYKEEIKQEREGCDRRHAEIQLGQQKISDTLRDILHILNGISQSRAMEKALRERLSEMTGIKIDPTPPTNT